VAQAFVFIVGGFETAGTTLSYALYELAFHPDIQSRLRAEIMQVTEKYLGELTYDSVLEMSYLDMVVSGKRTEISYVLWTVTLSVMFYLQDGIRLHITSQKTTFQTSSS
jgi:hypothetical protein